MAWLELSMAQKKILTALIQLYEQDKGYIKSELIAESTGFESDSVHSQMQELKKLQLVKGVIGPVGAYKPTVGAYEVLNRDESQNTP
ncbi:hypothetical protein [Halocatena marina]|uniref:hypothetical protein n=1 Tax=Halocatena marina TaxID=2934937 RepID=UPI00200D7FA7|nr:hypothetical protein [Halocatena marina]